MTKVFISSDIEGCAGIVDWQQVLGSGPDYEMGRRLLVGEINAAIDGAMAGGAKEIVVNDSHWTMQNVDPEALHGQASYISGRYKPPYMMQGLDPTFDAVFEIDVLNADMAGMATWIKGAKQTATRTVVMESSDPLELYRAFVAIVFLTRSIVEHS